MTGFQFRDSSQFMNRKCENNAFENTDTFDGWLCDSVLAVVLLNAYSMGHQWSFRLKDLSVNYGSATVQQDAIAQIKFD